MFYGEASRTQQKAAVGSLTLVAIHHSGNREFDSSQVNWLLDKIHHALEAENRIYHPKYPVQNLNYYLCREIGKHDS